VKLLTVAFGTGHTLLGPVDIGSDSCILSKVLGTDTGTVTGNAVILRRGGLAELVTGNQTSTNLVRPADMALTAGRVALLAVVSKNLTQWRAFFQIAASGFKSRLKSFERSMETNRIGMGNILMTGIAICLGRVGYQSQVSQFLIFIPAVSPVTDNTADLTMGTLHKIGVFQEDLLPYLQRR